MNTKTLIISLLAASALTSCDNIDKADRYIELEPVYGSRTVLVEEYTGQFCVNCPAGHDILHSLSAQYGDKFIAVSIHGTNLAIPEGANPKFLGLKTPESDQYASEAGAENLPQARIDRATSLLDRDAWPATVRERMAVGSVVDIEISPVAFDADSREVSLKVKVSSSAACEGFLQLWLVESGIKAIQQTPEDFNYEYVHNRVFRTSLNGHDGEAIKLGFNDECQTSTTFTLDSKYVAENCEIVAFVYGADGIENAAVVPLIPEN